MDASSRMGFGATGADRPAVLALSPSPPVPVVAGGATSAPSAVQFFRSGWDGGGYTAPAAAVAPHSSRSGAALGLGVQVPGPVGMGSGPPRSAHAHQAAFDAAHAASEASFWNEAAAATPLSPRSAGAANTVAAAALREERESERSRRRIALRKKSGHSKRFSGAGSLSGASSPQQSPVGNDPATAALHPSLQHQLMSTGSLSFSLPSSSPPAASSSPPVALSLQRATPGSTSARKTQPLHDDGPMIGSGGGGGGGGVHRIDVAPDPEADLDVIERAHRSFWARVQSWDAAARARALRLLAAVHAVAALALLITCAGVMETSFANPGLHWSAMAAAAATVAVAEILRRAAQKLDVERMMLWLVCSGVSVVACLLLGILSFHSDALGLDESVRARWAGLSLEQREVSSSYSDLKTHCLRNFAVLGVACVALVAVQVCLMCMVLAIRTHILSEQAHVYQSLARQNQFNTRLHNRQRMARLSEQMKERRKLRKVRGRTPSSAGSVGGAGSSPFTGLGSVAAAAAAALAPSASSSSSRTPAALELASLVPSGGGGPGAASSSFGSGLHLHAASPSLSPLVGLVDGDLADRYAGMLSEEVEAELERDEQKREFEDAQAAAARAMARA